MQCSSAILPEQKKMVCIFPPPPPRSPSHINCHQMPYLHFRWRKSRTVIDKIGDTCTGGLSLVINLQMNKAHNADECDRADKLAPVCGSSHLENGFPWKAYTLLYLLLTQTRKSRDWDTVQLSFHDNWFLGAVHIHPCWVWGPGGEDSRAPGSSFLGHHQGDYGREFYWRGQPRGTDSPGKEEANGL